MKKSPIQIVGEIMNGIVELIEGTDKKLDKIPGVGPKVIQNIVFPSGDASFNEFKENAKKNKSFSNDKKGLSLTNDNQQPVQPMA